MRIPRLVFICFLLPLSSLSLSGQESNAASTARANLASAQYPDTPEGLRALLKSLAAAVQKNDPQESARITQSMIIDDPAWFTSTFGTDLGGQIANRYDRTSEQVPNIVTAKVRSKMQTPEAEPQVTRVESVDQPASQNFRAIMIAMKNPVPLYGVQFTDKSGSETTEFRGAFVYE